MRAALIAANPRFARLDEAAPGAWGEFGQSGALSAEPFRSPVADYYRTDPISRASATMAECSATFVRPLPATGTGA